MFLKNREGETAPDCCSHSSKAWAVLQANRKEQGSKSSIDKAEEKVLHRLKTICMSVERSAPFFFSPSNKVSAVFAPRSLTDIPSAVLTVT